MMKKQKLLNCVASSVLLTGLGTSVAFAGGDGRDLGGYGANTYQPIAEAPRQYEESPDIMSFGIQPEPAPVVAAVEPEPEPAPEPPFAVAMGGINDLASPCAIDQTEEDSAHLKSDLDRVLAAPEDDISAGCGDGVNVADLDKGIDFTDGGSTNTDGPSSLVNAGLIRAGGSALSGGDLSEIDSLLSLSAGDPGEDAAANRPALIELTVGDNFLFGEDGNADPINVTLLDAINGDGTEVPEGGTSGTPLDALLDPINAATGGPGLLGLDLSGRPTNVADPDFDGLVEANLGNDEDPAGFNLVQVDALDDALSTGGLGHITVGDGLLDEGAGTIADGDLGDNLIGVTLGPDPTGNENDNLVQVTLDNTAFGDLGDQLGLRTAEVINPDSLQTAPGLASLAGLNGPAAGALAPLVDLFRPAAATTPGSGGGAGTTGTPLDALIDPLAATLGGGGGLPALPGAGGGTTGPTGTPLDAVLAPLAGGGLPGAGGGTTGPTGTPLDAVLAPLTGALGGGAPGLPAELDPATLAALLGGGGAGGGTTGTPLDAALDPITAALGGGLPGGGAGGLTGTPLDGLLAPVTGLLGL